MRYPVALVAALGIVVGSASGAAAHESSLQLSSDGAIASGYVLVTEDEEFDAYVDEAESEEYAEVEFEEVVAFTEETSDVAYEDEAEETEDVSAEIDEYGIDTEDDAAAIDEFGMSGGGFDYSHREKPDKGGDKGPGKDGCSGKDGDKGCPDKGGDKGSDKGCPGKDSDKGCPDKGSDKGCPGKGSACSSSRPKPGPATSAPKPGATHPVTGAAAVLYGIGGALFTAVGGSILLDQKRRKVEQA